MAATDEAAANETAISVYVRRDGGADALAAIADEATRRGLLLSAIAPARLCAILRGSRVDLLNFRAAMETTMAERIAGAFGLDHADLQPPIACIRAVSGDGTVPAAFSASLPPGDGAGHCIGVLSLGGGIDYPALAACCAVLGIAAPDRPPHVVAVDAARLTPEPADGPLLPMLLLLAALVPKSKVVVYVAPPSIRGWVDALSAAIHDADNRPAVVCCGWRLVDPPVLTATLAAQADAARVRLALPESGEPSTADVASGRPGHAWGGPAIDATLRAAALLRQAAPTPANVAAVAPTAHNPAAPADPTPAAPPATPSRPHFDALTTFDPPVDGGYREFVAYDTDRYPGLPAAVGLPMVWGLLPGSMAQDIAAGGGTVWALSGIPVAGGVALYRWTPTGWLPARAGGTALAVDAQGRPWLADALGTLFRFNGNDWSIVGSGVHDIALDSAGGVWALSSERHTDGRTVLHRLASPTGDGAADTDTVLADWTEEAIRAERIVAGPDGTPWIVTQAGTALRRDGRAWVREADNVRDVAIDADGRVWVASLRGGRIYRRDGAGQGWRRAEGIADRLVVTPDGAVWAITPHALVAAGRVAGPEPDNDTQGEPE